MAGENEVERDIYLTADRLPLIRDIGSNKTYDWYSHPNRVLDYDVFLFVAEGSIQVIEEGNEYVVGENKHLFLKKGLIIGVVPRRFPERSGIGFTLLQSSMSESNINGSPSYPSWNTISPTIINMRFRCPNSVLLRFTLQPKTV